MKYRVYNVVGGGGGGGGGEERGRRRRNRNFIFVNMVRRIKSRDFCIVICM